MSHARLPHPCATAGALSSTHLWGASAFALIVGFQLYGVLLAPVDLFVHRSFVLDAVKTLVWGGGLYYAFSLALLRHCPLPVRRAVPYAVTSLVLLVLALYPVAPVGMAGMMRRTAGSETHVDLGAWLAGVRAVQWSAGAGFLAVQGAFLRFAWRRPHING